MDETKINTIESDWRYDVFAACFAQKGYNIDDIFVRRIGDAKRNVAKDVEEISIKHSDSGNEYLELAVNKAGMYDSLPEGLFHASIYPYHSKNKDQILEEIKQHRNEEFFIRRFFNFFESEIDSYSIDIQLHELCFDKMDEHQNFADAFSSYWQIVKFLPLEQANLFIRFLPYISDIRKSVTDISCTMSKVLGVCVEVKSVCKTKDISLVGTYNIDNMRLEDKSVISGDLYDGISDYEITIDKLQACQVQSFLPGGILRKGFDLLCNMLLSADAEIYFQINTIEQEKYIHLNTEQSTYPCYLGINSFLKD